MVRLPLTPAEVERGRRLGALLRQARGERSILTTALDAGVSPETLRKIESGWRQPSESYFARHRPFALNPCKAGDLVGRLAVLAIMPGQHC